MGQGTTFKIKIPLTLAIIPALIVTSGGDRYAIPQGSLLELVRLEGAEAHRGIEMLYDVPVYRLRGNLLPLVYLNSELQLEDTTLAAGTTTTDEDTINIVVLQADDYQFGLVVDAMNDTQEIVVKPLGKPLKEISTFAGATILGYGKVALMDTTKSQPGKSATLEAQNTEQVEVTKGKLVHDNSTEAQLKLLLDTLKAAKNGDFTVRLPVNKNGLSEIAEVFNQWVSLNEKFASEIVQVSKMVGEEGKLTERVSLGAANGLWATSIDSINTLINNLTKPTTEAERVLSAIAQGDLSQKIALTVEGRPLKPDGYLFLGGGETTINLDDSFKRVQFNKTVCYRLHP